MLNVCEKLLSKSSGESVFTVHYDTIDTYTLILKIDMPMQILELNQIPIYTRIENLKIILSKEDENHMIVFTEGPNKVDLSVFYHMVEALPISDYLEFSNNKLKFLGDIHHGESILLDFFSLLLSFMGSYAAIKLNAFLLAYKNKDSQKAVKRTDPVPKVIFIHKSKFDTFTKDNKRVNYHLYSTFYRAAIKKQDSANIFLPEYTCRLM